MNFGNIPDYVLDLPIEDCYEKGTITLRLALESYNEDIESSEWGISSTKAGITVVKFMGWTKNYVIWYQGAGPFDGLQFFPRNP